MFADVSDKSIASIFGDEEESTIQLAARSFGLPTKMVEHSSETSVNISNNTPGDIALYASVGWHPP
jgi:hypothetical protein